MQNTREEKSQREWITDYDTANTVCLVARWVKIVAWLLVALILGCNSVYVIQAQEQAVVNTLGSVALITDSGPHLKIPFVQNVTKVSMTTSGMPIGFNEADNTWSEESQMMTSDSNFVRTDFYLEYKVSDPIKYLFATANPERIMRDMACSYIRDTVGAVTIDSILTTGKTEVQNRIKMDLSARLLAEDIGLEVHNIIIQDAMPPTDEIGLAFKDVENAKQEKETLKNTAYAYSNEKKSQTLAQADSVVQSATAQKESRINEATGQVQRFEALYAEYKRYPLITRERMYYETLEQLLPGRKIIIQDGNGGTQTLLPIEPFN